MGQMFSQAFPPKSKYDPARDMPDLKGKVFLVTGGNSGIGYATIKVLLQKNAKVYLAARSEAKASAAIEKLKVETKKEPHFLKLDLSSLKDVKCAAEEFKEKETRLDVLINNAGVMLAPKLETTVEGYDLQFGTNVLGHHFLTKLLLPVLESTAASLPAHEKGNVRVVTLSSSGVYMWEKKSDLLYETILVTPETKEHRKKVPQMDLYGQSKVGNAIFANELARQLAAKNSSVISCSLNPGNIYTDLARDHGWLFKFIVSKIVYPVENGALTSLWASTSPEGSNFNGQFLIPWARLGKAPHICEDEKVGKRLWDWCEEQIAKV
ncbi:NAD-binding protein [Flagelloscypha sp. PMI_526]|nr:NAD-binding protein [Flagelloscypha sp. PMI_526]